MRAFDKFKKLRIFDKLNIFNKSGLNFGRRRKKFNVYLFKYRMTWAVQIASVVLLAYLTVAAFGMQVGVVGQAMQDTLENGDTVMVNKLAIAPKANDVIVFLPNGNVKSHYYVRRVIGMPGESIQIIDGHVYINGEEFTEKISVPIMTDPGTAEESIVLGEDEYFVLGDNRNNSEDSRYANIGVVKKDYIVGTVWLKIDTEGAIGFIH